GPVVGLGLGAELAEEGVGRLAGAGQAQVGGAGGLQDDRVAVLQDHAAEVAHGRAVGPRRVGGLGVLVRRAEAAGQLLPITLLPHQVLEQFVVAGGVPAGGGVVALGPVQGDEHVGGPLGLAGLVLGLPLGDRGVEGVAVQDQGGVVGGRVL